MKNYNQYKTHECEKCHKQIPEMLADIHRTSGACELHQARRSAAALGLKEMVIETVASDIHGIYGCIGEILTEHKIPYIVQSLYYTDTNVILFMPSYVWDVVKMTVSMINNGCDMEPKKILESLLCPSQQD